MSKDKKTKRPGLFDELDLSHAIPSEYYVIRRYSETDNGVIRPVPGTIEIASYETLHLTLPDPTSDSIPGTIMTIRCYEGRKHTLSGVFGRMFGDEREPYKLRVVFNYYGSRIDLMSGCDRWLVWAHHNMSIASDGTM